jgi:hypothetical protein
MSEGTPLGDILNDEQPDETPEVSETPIDTAPAEADEGSGPSRDERGRFAPKETGVEPGTAPEVPPTEPTDRLPKDVYEPLKAIRGENKQLREELEQLRKALTQPQQPPQEAPSLWEDEQGWQQHLTQEVGNSAAQWAAMNARLDTSEMLARDKFDDFDDMKAKFLELAAANPTIAEEARADPHPWRRAYMMAKNHEKMQSLAAVDVNDLEAKLREQIKAELLREAEAQLPAGLPPSISSQRSVAGRGGPAWTGPTPIGDILS